MHTSGIPCGHRHQRVVRRLPRSTPPEDGASWLACPIGSPRILVMPISALPARPASLECAPATRPVVGDDLPEYRAQRGRVDLLAFTDRHRAPGLVGVASGDDL